MENEVKKGDIFINVKTGLELRVQFVVSGKAKLIILYSDIMKKKPLEYMALINQEFTEDIVNLIHSSYYKRK